ncbi:MAG: polysaccharide pyruvyl transferase family protein [Candidatus Shapirobacteria bacterium]|nr:polysaccharide pyruvyl transferase family protein [Candidatus Shapirobacteria bacterium]
MKILLFANIGTANNGFYHIGDEAMFLETYYWYQKNHKSTNLSIFTSKKNHQNLKVTELLNFDFNNEKPRIYFLKLILKFLLYKFSKTNFLSKNEFEFINIIREQDIIHFCGGGNLTSLFKPWLFYSYSLIVIAKILGKKIFLTSQTIGPFNFTDKVISFFVLNLVKVINIREPNNSLLKYGIILPNIGKTLDAAHSLPTIKNKNINIARQSKIRIGISIHQWKNYNEILVSNLVRLIQQISKKYSIEILLIPHIIATNEFESYGDVIYMSKITKKLKNSIIVLGLDINFYTQTNYEIAQISKTLTSTCDLVFSSRYHGIVFSLSENVPCMTFISDEYYSQKNIGALNFYYSEKYSDYSINLNNKNIFNELKNKTERILKNIDKEKKYITDINKQFSTLDNKFYKNLIFN